MKTPTELKTGIKLTNVEKFALLGGMSSKELLKAHDEYVALCDIANAAENHQNSKPGQEMENWMILQKALCKLVLIRSKNP